MGVQVNFEAAVRTRLTWRCGAQSELCGF